MYGCHVKSLNFLEILSMYENERDFIASNQQLRTIRNKTKFSDGPRYTNRKKGY